MSASGALIRNGVINPTGSLFIATSFCNPQIWRHRLVSKCRRDKAELRNQLYIVCSSGGKGRKRLRRSPSNGAVARKEVDEDEGRNVRLILIDKLYSVMEKMEEVELSDDEAIDPNKTVDTDGFLYGSQEQSVRIKQSIAIARDLLDIQRAMAAQEMSRPQLTLRAIDCNEDLLYEQLDLRAWKKFNKCYPTDEISRVMEEFGGFPSKVFYRLAIKMIMKMFFAYVSEEDGTELMDRQARRDRSFALIGQRGVGKSTFLVLLAFILAKVYEQRVLYLRRENDNTLHHVVYMTPSAVHGASFKSLSRALAEVDNISRGANSWFFVDGYPGEELEESEDLRDFNVLATFSKIDVKTNFPTRACHLAIWEHEEFVAFAKETTDWDSDPKGFEEEFIKHYRDAAGCIGNFLSLRTRRRPL